MGKVVKTVAPIAIGALTGNPWLGAATGFQSFNSAIGVGNTTYYTIAGQSSSEWEVGLGTLTGATTLARTTVLASSASGSPVSFSAGTKDVFVTFPAEGFAAPPAIGGTTPAAITGTTVTVRTELDFPTVTPSNAGTGVIKMVDDGTGSGYDVLEIYSDDSGSPYTVRFPGGIQGAPMYLLSPDYLTNYHYINLTTPSGMTGDYTLQFPPTAGSANQYLKTDGTGVLSWAAVSGTGTVTSVAALTLGTSGTDLSSTVANGTTTPVITLNVPTASASNRGALSSTDWSTFNNKQATLVSGTNIKTINSASLLGSGNIAVATVAGSDKQIQYNNAGALGAVSNFIFDGRFVGLGTTTISDAFVGNNGVQFGNSSITGIGVFVGVYSNLYNNSGGTSRYITNGAAAGSATVSGNMFYWSTAPTNAGAAGAAATLSTAMVLNGDGVSGYLQVLNGITNTPIGVGTPSTGTFTTIASATAPTLTVPALALTGTPNSSTSAKTGVLGIGPNFTATDKNILASFVQGINDYTQIVTQNTNAGTTASADFIVNNDSTTGAGTYGDFGINSSGFTGTGSFNAPNSVYLYSQGGDLVVGTQSANVVRFVIGSSTAADAGTITSTGLNAFPIGATTASTGAFTTLSASSTVSGTGFSTYLASPPAIGGTTAAAGTFTTLVANTSIGAGVASPSALVNIKAGTATASTAPLKFTSGTNLTAVEAGAVEYDGTKWYATTGETGSSRSVLDNSYQYYVNSTSGAIGSAIADLFASAAFTMQAGGIYVIEWHSYLTKTTAGTLTFTVTTSQTPQSVTAGFCNAQSALTASNAVVAGATTTTAMPASASIATGAVVYIPVRAVVTANASTGGTVTLRVTNSAGTVTLGRGSHIIVRRLSGSTTVGAFA